MKKCPYCAEKIQEEAVVCHYCGKDLPKVEVEVEVELNGGGNTKTGKVIIIVGSVLFIALAVILILFLKITEKGKVYIENFNDPATLSDWDVKTKDQNVNVLAEDGGYHFRVENGSVGSFLRRKNFSDSVLTVDLQFLTTEPAIVSIICRNLEGGYGFELSNNGQWTLEKSGKLLGSGETGAIRTGVNKVKVSCIGQQFSLEVNNEMVGVVNDPEFAVGEIGLGLSSNGPAEVVFDNLKIVGGYTQIETPESEEESAEAAEVKTTSTPTSSPTSQATSTPTPAPTLRPTPIPTDQVVLYQTDFEDSDTSLEKWTSFAYSYPQDTISTEGYEITTGTSYYRIKASQTNQRIYSIYDVDLGTSDVDLSLEMPMYDHGTAGLVCRYTEQGWYQFMFDEPGMWSIRMAKADEAGILQFYLLASGNRPAHEGIRAECKGDQLTLYFNDILTSSLHDDTFPEGKIGIVGWSFNKTGKVAFIDNFSVKRAEWRESDLVGPAPTPLADGTIYTTDFGINNDLVKYWVGTTKTEVLGPASTRSITTYLNDFDPGTSDVEITANASGAWLPGLICRYSSDGWYEAISGNSPAGRYVSINRVQRGSDGVITSVGLGGSFIPKTSREKMVLTCKGNQISVSIDDKLYAYAEENYWSSGRYGFLFSSDLSTNPADVFTGYTIKPLTRPAGEKTLLLTDDFEDIAVSKLNWNLPQEDIPGYQFTDGAVVLTNNWLQSRFSPMRNAEVTLEMEFLNNSNGPFSFYSPLGVFEFTSDGNWNFRGVDFFQSSNDEPTPNIHADKNVVTYRCFDGQFTFIANGETIVAFDNLSYNEALIYLDPNSTAVKIGASADSQIKIDNLSLSTISSALPVSESPGLPNQVGLPQYEPGETVFSFLDTDLRYDMWCPGNHNPRWFGPCLTPTDPIEEIIVPSVKDMHYWYDKQYLNNAPVEMSIETTFSSKTGAIGLMCRYTQLGRYEFVIQPDGSWAIRQNTAYWYAPSAANITVLAHGESDVIRPDKNQLTVICQGDDLIFTANGTELGRVKDSLYPEGYAGFFFDVYTAGSFTNLNIKVPE